MNGTFSAMDLPAWADWIATLLLLAAGAVNLVMAHKRFDAPSGLVVVARALMGWGKLCIAGGWLYVMLNRGYLRTLATTEVGAIVWAVGSLGVNTLQLLRNRATRGYRS